MEGKTEIPLAQRTGVYSRNMTRENENLVVSLVGISGVMNIPPKVRAQESQRDQHEEFNFGL